jgi:hypothetical protein
MKCAFDTSNIVICRLFNWLFLRSVLFIQLDINKNIIIIIAWCVFKQRLKGCCLVYYHSFASVYEFSCLYSIFKANLFDSPKRDTKTHLNYVFRWLVVVYGHSQGVESAVKACAVNLDNVAVIALPEISGNGTEVNNLNKSKSNEAWAKCQLFLKLF